MLFRKPKNPLRTFIFADARVLGITRQGSDLLLDLVDYRDSTVRIAFRGVAGLDLEESVEGLELTDARFERLDDRWKLSLLDDDHENVLAVEYIDAEIEWLRDSGE